MFLNITAIYSQDFTIDFRVLGYAQEEYGQCILSLNQPINIKMASLKGFQELKIRADWDGVEKYFRYIHGKPWDWCYHVYDKRKQENLENDDVIYSQHMILNEDLTSGGFDVLLRNHSIIEWLPCMEFKLNF